MANLWTREANMGLAIGLPLLFALAPANADDPAVVAGRERERLVRTARFEVRVREVHARGSRSELAGLDRQVPVPSVELAVESDSVLVLDGNQVRVETNQPLWSGTQFGPPRSRISMWDGKRLITFVPEGLGSDGTPQAFIEPGSITSPASSVLWLPVGVTIRGLSPGIVPDVLTALTPGVTTELIDWDECREYHAAGKGPVHSRYWIAPGSDATVRRVRDVNAGRTVRQTDIRYRQDDRAGPLPSGWVTTEYGSTGRPMVVTTVTVTTVQLNEPVPDGAFAVSCPTGTLIGDAGTGKDYRVDSDGTWQPVNLASLIPPTPQSTSTGRNGTWWAVLIGGVGSAVVLAVVLMLLMRRRRPVPA